MPTRAVQPLCALLLAALLVASALHAADGTLDPTFGGGDGGSFLDIALDPTSRDTAEALAVQPDGRIVVAGFSTDDDGEQTKAVVVRLTAAGAPDGTFGSGGIFALDFSSLGLGYVAGKAYAVTLDDAGRILVAGELTSGADQHALIFRLTPSGALDSSFFGDGVAVGAAVGTAYDIAFDRINSIVWVVGESSPNWTWTWRWNGTSAAEHTWYIPGATEQYGRSIVVQPDGKPIIGGSFYLGSSNNWDIWAARLLADGTAADTSFGSGGLVTHGYDLAPPTYDDDLLLDLALDAEGRLVALAESESGPGTFDSSSDLGFARWTSGGTPDSTFGTGGFEVLIFLAGSGRDAWYEGALATQGDGKILAGMAPGSSPFTVQAGVVRLLENGNRDTAFGGSGTGLATFDLEPQGGPGDERCGFAAIGLDSGRLVGAGASEWLDPDFDFGFARLTNAYIFADGFEIGSSFFWSSSLP